MDSLAFLDQTINTIKGINWAISLLAAIPLSIVANLLTPIVANYLSKSSLERRKKRIERLKAERDEVYTLMNDKDKQITSSFIALFKVLMFIAIASIISVIGILSFPLSALLFLLAFSKASQHITLLKNCLEFTKYENRITSQIEDLEEKVPDTAPAKEN